MDAATTDDLRRRLYEMARKVDALPRAYRPHLAALLDAMAALLDEMTERDSR